jgi:hypothetical protein
VRANKHGTTLEAELLASGAVSEDIYYEALAEILGIPFLRRLDPDEIEDLPGADSQLIEPTIVRLRHPNRAPTTAIVPSVGRLEFLHGQLSGSPQLRAMMASTTPTALRTALWQAGRHRRLRETVDQLFGGTPEASARITFWGRQGFYTGATLTMLAVLAASQPVTALLVSHIVLTLFFLASFLIRRVSLFAMRRQPVSGRSIPSSSRFTGRRP